MGPPEALESSQLTCAELGVQGLGKMHLSAPKAAEKPRKSLKPDLGVQGLGIWEGSLAVAPQAAQQVPAMDQAACTLT